MTILEKKRDKGMLYVPRAGIMGNNTWLEPDFFYVSAITEARLKGEHHTNADLVVEVICAESAVYDRNTKSDTYAALGVKELWLVDELSGTIEIRVLEDNSYNPAVFDRDHQMKSVVFPDLKLKMLDVFEN